MNPLDADLPPEFVDDAERADLLRVAQRLQSGRPVIRASMRGDIRRGLNSLPARSRPRHLRRLVAGFACVGATCLAIASLGLADESSAGTAKADTGPSLSISRSLDR